MVNTKEAKISQLESELSRYLSFVRRGEVVRILDRNVPIAQIVPILSPGPEQDVGAEALIEMERKGLIRRGTGRLERESLDADPPGKPCGVMAALIAERAAR